MITLEGYILHFIKYGDSDAVLHLFTYEEGFQTCFYKGIFSAKNKNKSLVTPLRRIRIVANKKGSNGLLNISKIENLAKDDTFDIRKNTVIFFAAGFLNQLLKHENSNPSIYQEIGTFLNELHKDNFQSHLIFLLQILKIHGVAPLTETTLPFLNPEVGHFENHLSHNYFNNDISNIWLRILTSSTPYQEIITPSFRKNFLESAMIYYQYHFTDFKIPNSLEVIQQIFD